MLFIIYDILSVPGVLFMEIMSALGLFVASTGKIIQTCASCTKVPVWPTG